MKKIIFLIAYFLSAFNVEAQFNVDWVKTLGDSGNDLGFAICATKDGGYIIAGTSNSNAGEITGNHGGYDYVVLKLDKNDSIQWQKCYGGTANEDASAIQQTTDGGYIVAGETSSNNKQVNGNHGAQDYWVIRIDSIGNLIWQKCFGGSNSDFARDVIQTHDRGFMILGSTASNDGNVTGQHGEVGFTSDVWAVKTDSNGNIQWEHAYGGTGDDQGYSVIQLPNGNYYLGGFSNSTDGDPPRNFGEYDDWLFQTDSLGNILPANGFTQFNQVFGGSQNDECYSICLSVSGKVIMAGNSNSNDLEAKRNFGQFDEWILKTDTAEFQPNQVLWENNYGGSSDDIAFSVIPLNNGDFMTCGSTNSSDSEVVGYHTGAIGGDEWVSAIDSIGNLIWQACIGGSNAEQGNAIAQLKDGTFRTVGITSSTDGNIILNHGEEDIMIAKISQNPNGIISIKNPNQAKFYPNPFRAQINVSIRNQTELLEKIKIINVLGQTVQESFVSKTNQVQIITNKLATGIYIIQLINDGLPIQSEKMIKIY